MQPARRFLRQHVESLAHHAEIHHILPGVSVTGPNLLHNSCDTLSIISVGTKRDHHPRNGVSV